MPKTAEATVAEEAAEIVTDGVVRFFNLENPGNTFLVSHDTSPGAILNPMTAAEKYASFANGELTTGDPEVIAWCRGPVGRRKGCREYGVEADMLEIRDTPELLQKYIEKQADIRARELIAEQMHGQSMAGR